MAKKKNATSVNLELIFESTNVSLGNGSFISSKDIWKRSIM